MPARKGTRPPAAGRGRKKGTLNKATGAAREMFTNFLDANVEKVQGLFDRVAKDDPARALELLTKVAEFVIPKLARTELKGELDVDLPKAPTFGISFANGAPGHPVPRLSPEDADDTRPSADGDVEESDEFGNLT